MMKAILCCTLQYQKIKFRQAFHCLKLEGLLWLMAVMMLFELCQKQGKQVDIKYWKNGEKNVATVYVDGKFIASSSSVKKETAKLNAAKQALLKLLESMPSNVGRLDFSFGLNKSFEIDGAKQKLHELCGKKKWPKPIYGLEKHEGPPHDKKYVYRAVRRSSVGQTLRRGGVGTGLNFLQTQVQNGEIRNMLCRVKAKSSSSLSTFNRYEKYQRLPVSSCFQFLKMDFKSEIRKLLEERRNLLLVVAILLVTISYQAILHPVGGLWQDNDICNTIEVRSSPDGTTDLSNTILPKTKAGFIMPNTDNKAVCEHKVGKTIAFEDGLFQVFLVGNAITFLISKLLIIFLVPN
ncbi:ribonuclease 3-like protein 2 [Quercus suber]|uniref:Ribonuclease 3-like protein 2 n=1 Tax=Quercus suber TaxID=58331 RepID=A0AAW0M3C2_QUESU